MRLAEVSWVEAQRLLNGTDTVILPVGSTEQHGPHCPLGTDHITADAVANMIGDKTGLLVLPVIPVGISGGHRQFPGTIWVPPAVFRDYVKAVILSAASHGPRKFFVVNGHGGNTPSLHEVAEELRSDADIFMAFATAYPTKLDGHAGEDETSIMLYLRPDLVDMAKALDAKQGEELAGIKMKTQKVGPAEFGYDTTDLTPTGVFGAAGKTIMVTKAAKEHGEEIVKDQVAELSVFAEQLKKAKLEELLPKPHK